MSKPIAPSEVLGHKKQIFPPEVFEVWNDLIAKNFLGNSSKVYWKDASEGIRAKLNISRNEVHAQHYLDVEDLYRAEGWKVTIDSPGYNESYDGSTTFRK